MTDIDLDLLADGYRLRPMSEAARSRARTSADGCSGWLLDIGGGAGEHAATWSADGQHPVVVDPSASMVAKSAVHPNIDVVRAHAQHLPFRGESTGLAYFHLSIHYGDWRAALDEAMRVVRPGGRIEIWTIDPDEIEHSSLGRWFPSVIEIDTERFPDPEMLAERCALGGGNVSLSRSSEPIDRTAGAWIDAVRARFVSTLQLIGDEEIEEGLARFEKAYPDRNRPYRYELALTRISTVA